MVSRFSIFIVVLFIFQLPVFAENHHPQEFLQSISGAKNEGEKIYAHFCVNCHAVKPLISIGAPRIAEAADWNVRLKQGLELLFKHANEGINAMPARGGCFECSDKQLMLAIQFMLPKEAESRKNL